MSDTPETEKLNGRLDYSLTDAYLLMTQHSRKLERERDDALKSASDHLYQFVKTNLRLEKTNSYLEEIKSERDLWRLEAENWRKLSLGNVQEVLK